MNPRLYFDEKTSKKLGDVFVVNTYFPIKTVPDSADYFLLVYIAHSNAIHNIDNTSRKLEEGDVVLISTNVVNSFTCTHKDELTIAYCCAFSKNALQYSLKQYSGNFPLLSDFFEGKRSYIQVHDTPSKTIRNFMIQMIDNFNYSQPGYLFSIRSTITLILVNMFRLYSVDKNKADGFHSNVVINNVTNYINSKIYSKLSLNEVADKFGITPQHLCRLFKKHFNMTFTQFSNRQRVDKIRDELENIDRPIYQTYEEFDFTPQYLNSMFKKYTGYSISEYKAKFNYKAGNPLYTI